MPILPPAFLESLPAVPGFDLAAFGAIHQSGKQVTSIRINPAKTNAGVLSFGDEVGKHSVPWTKYGYYLSQRPSFTFDPLLHAGAYYVQEPSSMFLEQALQHTLDLNSPLHVLDLCAAPGGKSTHIQSLLNSQSVLVNNELIRPRVNILLENITKWGAANTIVTNNDPADFASCTELFDAIVVDAPCSGSGLFRKDPDAISEWSEANVQMCSMRQQRIIKDIWPALKPGGRLIYSTCSYSFEEDEAIADFITENFDAASEAIPIQPGWGIIETSSPVHQNKGYRFYPSQLDGEGFYLACFRKPVEENETAFIRPFKQVADKKIIAAAAQWLSENFDHVIYQHKEQVFALTPETMKLFSHLQKLLNVRKAGIKIGDWARDEIIPDHALALSTVYNPNISTIELDHEQAVAYLRKAVFDIDHLRKGWLMATYKTLPLGWIKSMGNRFNNYYPKDWRIRS